MYITAEPARGGSPAAVEAGLRSGADAIDTLDPHHQQFA
jgi:hypothetical protein